ncbi:MAG: EAL domain-containing protein [Pseudomonadota bacterium]|nr:EAL domain-containing protein [Pseudomonadota bacterium]
MDLNLPPQLLYQPIADLQHGGVCAVALVGCRDDAGAAGGAPPDFAVWRHACDDLRRWREAGLPALRLALTLSAAQLDDADLARAIGALLTDTDTDPAQLVLEIAESVLVAEATGAAAALAALRLLGVNLALGQFGTTASSLSHLERFPLGRVNLHRQLARHGGADADDAARVKTIIAMAHHLGLLVQADGVDTEAQCDFLCRNMCDQIQGDFFGAAVDAGAIAALLTAQHSLPAHLLRFPRSRKRTLLLVDDEPNIVAALKRLLRSDGYQILSALSGQDGLDVLANNDVDVIVSDQRMPGMLGADFLRAAKVRYPHTIRIMLSGYTELQSVTAAVNEGAIYKFLTKPWEDEQLRGHIAEAFRLKEIADENERLNGELRTANDQLAQANRKMEALLQYKQQQISLGESSLNVARELLQFLPLPIIGLDDEGMLAFVNAAADTLFVARGAILGSEAAIVLPELFGAGALCRGTYAATIDGRACDVLVHPMGSNSTSRGSLITISGAGERP